MLYVILLAQKIKRKKKWNKTNKHRKRKSKTFSFLKQNTQSCRQVFGIFMFAGLLIQLNLRSWRFFFFEGFFFLNLHHQRNSIVVSFLLVRHLQFSFLLFNCYLSFMQILKCWIEKIAIYFLLFIFFLHYMCLCVSQYNLLLLFRTVTMSTMNKSDSHFFNHFSLVHAIKQMTKRQKKKNQTTPKYEYEKLSWWLRQRELTFFCIPSQAFFSSFFALATKRKKKQTVKKETYRYGKSDRSKNSSCEKKNMKTEEASKRISQFLSLNKNSWKWTNKQTLNQRNLKGNLRR